MSDHYNQEYFFLTNFDFKKGKNPLLNALRDYYLDRVEDSSSNNSSNISCDLMNGRDAFFGSCSG